MNTGERTTAVRPTPRTALLIGPFRLAYSPRSATGHWTLNFTWQGVGPFPRAERAKLRTIVSTAHRRGQTVRFWATPDLGGPARDALWAELIAADVDHLNTDDLAGLEAFLDAHRSA